MNETLLSEWEKRPICLAIIAIVVSFFTGGAAGSVITLIITGRRDIRARKRKFIAFLYEWKSEVSTFQMKNSIWDVKGACYTPKLPKFHAAVAEADGVFRDSNNFQRHTKRLAELRDKDWDAKNQPRDVILKAIDGLTEFCERAA